MQYDAEAYWLFPDGKIHSVRTCHIQEVINNPHDYGETLDNIRKAYDSFNEKMPHEGMARIEIMKRILERGYIRIRQKRNYWVMELNKFSDKEKKLISQWVNCVWGDLNDQYTDLKVYILQEQRLNIIPIQEFH